MSLVLIAYFWVESAGCSASADTDRILHHSYNFAIKLNLLAINQRIHNVF